jgi:hypothetical protein
MRVFGEENTEIFGLWGAVHDPISRSQDVHAKSCPKKVYLSPKRRISTKGERVFKNIEDRNSCWAGHAVFR